MPNARRKNQAPPKIEIPEGVVQLYANSLNVLTTPWDFVLLFGSIQLPDAIGGVGAQLSSSVRIDTAVTMSPQHAKAAMKVLQDAVIKYEKRFGEVPIPKGL